ncbi:MAG: methyltransferase domain-containing protein, partial [Candidatus Dormibacteraeota bacterium]|nr:methyltransferase domain-containing protein [Candidatus Dormibacteraeota bacterium]
RLARLVEITAPRPGWRVLDVATGTGHTAFAFAPAVAWVVATDLTEAMLRQAERVRKDRGYGNVELQSADVHGLPFADARFDLVTCRRAAHHFSRIEVALAEMHRVLKPGGRLLIDDRASPDDDEVDAILHRLDVLHDESHVRQYRALEWRRMLDAAGFVVGRLETYVQSRPLSAYTKDVDPARVAQVEEIVDRLTLRQREALELQQVDGETRLNHYYVSVVADRDV